MFIYPKLLKHETYKIEVLKFVSSGRQNQRVGWSKVVFVTVEVLSLGSKPPAAVGERISKSERHGLGAAAPLSTRASSLEQGSAGGPVQSSPKLIEHIGSGSTRFEEQLSPCIYCFSGSLCALASLGVRWSVCLHGKAWLASVLL